MELFSIRIQRTFQLVSTDNRACKGQIFRIFASLSPNYGRKSHGHGDISIL